MPEWPTFLRSVTIRLTNVIPPYQAESASMGDVPETTIESLIKKYDVLLFDAYGVLVNSSGALPGAVELIRHLNQTGKPYYILTNDASRLPRTASDRYKKSGLEFHPGTSSLRDHCFRAILNNTALKASAVLCWEPRTAGNMSSRPAAESFLPDKDFDVLVLADEIGYPFLETVDAVFSSVCRAMDDQRTVHLILPNPDLIYPKGDQAFGFGAGSIAGMFEAALRLRYPHDNALSFVRLGKPEEGLFQGSPFPQSDAQHGHDRRSTGDGHPGGAFFRDRCRLD